MDAVYLCRPGENEELRYSLRSLANVGGIDRVWIFGGKPEWTRGVRWYQLPVWGSKYETTTRAMRTVCEHPEISSSFLLMNDDFYVMRPGGLPPVANRGRVREVIAHQERMGSGHSAYTQGMRATLIRLEQHGFADPLSFELHVPLVVEKARMLEALDLCAGLAVPHKRTAYGAVAGLRGRKLADVKVYSDEPIPAGRFLSSQDDSFARLLPTLVEAFPHPSTFEP